jgi:hypothetical protein
MDRSSCRSPSTRTRSRRESTVQLVLTGTNGGTAIGTATILDDD